MSDISINHSLNSVNAANIIRANDGTSKASTSKTTDKAKKDDSKKDIVSEEYGPVVSVSEDGDTVRVKNEEASEGIHDMLQKEIENLEEQEEFETPDFNVYIAQSSVSKVSESETSEPAETESAVPAHEAYEPAAASSSYEAPEPDITSYVGYSDSELKEMYLEGDISQIDYNKEMDARKAMREAEEKEATEFNNSIADNISKLAVANQTENTVNTIENGETSSTIPDELRLQALQNFDTV